MTVSEQHIAQLLGQLTLEEKASLCSGQDFWSFKAIERLDIPSIWLADGPHGVRKAPTSDVPGFGDQHAATCYPTASAMAATWDKALMQQIGEHLGRECQAQDVHVLLGPGVNIKRAPTGGRNFEYFSEDPMLAGELAVSFIDGVQSQGVGTSLKHFACNSQETQRMLTSAEVDERTLREIYLPAFETAVKRAQPWTVMAAYNPLNGADSTASVYLLDQLLKQEWGFEGIVLSDWCAVYERAEGIKAGLHVEMPGSHGINDAKIVAAVKQGELDESQLDKLVAQILRVTFKAASYAKRLEKQGVSFDEAAHHQFARRVAADACVLLKNHEHLLPISAKTTGKLALIGEFAATPRIQGNGSSDVKPTSLDSSKQEITKLAQAQGISVQYAPGYLLDNDHDLALLDEAVAAAKGADMAVLHLGLPQHYEAEEYDREHIDLPPAQVELIRQVSKVQPNTVVVLTNGAAVAMPWLDQVPAVLEAWLGGQAAGGAIADVLFGEVNPSGRLAETFPKRIEDTPAFLDFPGQDRVARYSEGIFVGYRWYEKRDITPLFPFGHGLSYTEFAYSDLRVSREQLDDVSPVTVSCTVTNTGQRSGKEVVQLYITDPVSRLPRPVKELKGFEKVSLEPGESTQVSFTLTPRDFAYFDTRYNDWVVESGEFELMLGSSSQDIRLRQGVSLESQTERPLMFDARTTVREYLAWPQTKDLVLELLAPFIPAEQWQDPAMSNFMLDMPLCKFPVLSKGLLSEADVAELLQKAQQFSVRL